MFAVFKDLCLVVFPCAVIAAALLDLTSYTIPNRLCAALALAFLPAALAAGLPLPTFALCLLAGVVGLAAGIALFGFGVLGGGDAKLMAACLLWLGLPGAVPFLLWTAVAGGGLAVILMFARRAPLASVAGPGWVGRLLQPGGDVPYGVAIAVGALAAFPLSPMVRLAHGL